MGQLTQLFLFFALFLIVSCIKDKAENKEKEKNPDVLKEFRTFADSVIPEVKEPFTRNLKNLTSVKDPAHPFALYIDGPSVSQTSQNVTAASLGTITKDKAPSSTNLISKPINESSVQRNVTEPVTNEKQAITSTNAQVADSSKEEFDIDEDDDNSGGDSGDSDDTLTLTKDGKDGGNVIAEALATSKKDAPEAVTSFVSSNAQYPPSNSPAEAIATATNDAPEPITNPSTNVQLPPSNPPEAVMPVKKKQKKGNKAVSKNSTVIATPAASSSTNMTKNAANEKTEKPSEKLPNYKGLQKYRDALLNDVSGDDEVDTYIDEKEEKPKKMAKTNAEKKKHPKPKKRHGTKAQRYDHKSHRQMAKQKYTKTHIKPQVYVYNEPKPVPVEHNIGIGRDGALAAPPPAAAPAPAPPPPPATSVCMDTCSEACAPSCTPQCCAQETAPPPVKEADPPQKEKKIRWMERAHYEPGPNYPPPPIPPLVIKKVAKCAATCARSTCAPACLPSCCNLPPAPHVVGCSRQCTPRICVMGCPLHCCARYIKKSKVMQGITHKRN